jgi:hypothetical protein
MSKLYKILCLQQGMHFLSIIDESERMRVRRREDVHIYISSLLKCKMYLYLRVSIEEHLHCVTVEFKVKFYICITPIRDSPVEKSTTLNYAGINATSIARIAAHVTEQMVNCNG